jgi:flagellar biosynthesis chaperone FliJ
MNQRTLQILKKVRDMEQEREQFELQRRQKMELERHRDLEGWHARIRAAAEVPSRTQGGGDCLSRAVYLREADARREVSRREVDVARLRVAEQVTQLFKAKRRTDTIERLMEHQRENVRAEREMAERKEFDDRGQFSHYYHRHPEENL